MAAQTLHLVTLEGGAVRLDMTYDDVTFVVSQFACVGTPGRHIAFTTRGTTTTLTVGQVVNLPPPTITLARVRNFLQFDYTAAA